jgi:hypothetical protein
MKTAQHVFREVNEQIAAITLQQEESESGFLCECGRNDCFETIALSLADYEALRTRADLFIAAPGHCVEDVDRLVESRESFDVLEQV